MKNRIVGVSILLGAFAFSCFFALFVWEMYTQATLGPEIERELGFKMGTPYIDDGSTWEREVKQIHYVAPGGTFDSSGVAQGDIIVDDITLGQLYRMLDRSRDNPTTIHVVDGGDGQPLEHREVRAIVLHVPKRADQQGHE